MGEASRLVSRISDVGSDAEARRACVLNRTSKEDAS